MARPDSHVILQGWLKYIFMNPPGVYSSRSWCVKFCAMFFDNLFYSQKNILKYLFFVVLTTANIYILLTFDNYNNIPLRRFRVFLEESWKEAFNSVSVKITNFVKVTFIVKLFIKLKKS